MDHKRTVITSLNHESVFPLPRDIFEGWMWPNITNQLMRRLKAEDYENLLVKLGASCRWVTPHYIGPALPPGAKDRVASPHTTHSLNGAIWGLTPGVREHGLKSSGHPLGQASTLRDIMSYSGPSPDWFDYEGMVKAASSYKDFFVVAGGFSPLFYLIADLRGMEQTLVDVIDHPDWMEALVGKILEFYKGYFSQIARQGKGTIDAIAFGDDFSSQLNMLLSPAHWRYYFKQAWAELFDIAREYGYWILFHSCGSVYPVISDLVEIGLNVLYPIQPKAKNMELSFLRTQFGDQLSFYGGVDVQELVSFGNPHDVQAEVSRLEQLFSQPGGLILSTSHVIMDDFPEENILAVYGKN